MARTVREQANPADTMRNLLQVLNARYALVMDLDSSSIAARPYAKIAREFAKVAAEWADICDGYATVTLCNGCDKQRRCHTFENGAVFCRSCANKY